MTFNRYIFKYIIRLYALCFTSIELNNLYFYFLILYIEIKIINNFYLFINILNF